MADYLDDFKVCIAADQNDIGLNLVSRRDLSQILFAPRIVTHRHSPHESGDITMLNHKASPAGID